MPNINVKKRDGVIEPWSYDKLVTSIGKAGVPMVSAEDIASKIQAWAQENSDGIISSTEIRDRIIEDLKTNFPAEADNYKAYKKG